MRSQPKQSLLDESKFFEIGPRDPYLRYSRNANRLF